MKYRRFFALTLTGCLLSLSMAQAQTIATVNGVKISQSRLNAMARGQKLTPEQQKTAKDMLIQAEIAAQAAKKKNLQKNPAVAEMIELATTQILAEAYVADYSKNVTITPDELKNAYDQMVAVMSDKEYKVRLIVVASEADANGIIAQLKKGERFSTLAEQKSLNKESAAKGGQIGWVQPALFGNALNNVAKGNYTQTPVKTGAGYSVLLVEDIRPYKKPTFEEAKLKVEDALRNQKVTQHMATLREQAKIQ